MAKKPVTPKKPGKAVGPKTATPKAAPKTTKKAERRGHTLLGQFLLGTKTGSKS